MLTYAQEMVKNAIEAVKLNKTEDEFIAEEIVKGNLLRASMTMKEAYAVAQYVVNSIS